MQTLKFRVYILDHKQFSYFSQGEFRSNKEGLLEQSRLMKYKKEGNRFYDRVEVVGNIFESKHE